MKIHLKDLEKVMAWVKANTNAVTIDIDTSGGRVVVRTIDKYEKICELTIFEEKVAMMPTVTATDRLR
jgi:hypothetical protein